MENIVIVDSGRAFTKRLRGTKTEVFQSVIAKSDGFNLLTNTRPSDILVNYKGDDWAVGDLAIRQFPDGILQNRDEDKTNMQNEIQTLTACSMLTGNREHVTLLANCPAGDWGKQRDKIKEAFLGVHKIVHGAGDMKGKVIDFVIDDCHVIPEAEAAYFGYCYDLNLNLVYPKVYNSNVLVLDIGDQTVNYVSMNPEGEPLDTGSGSINFGMFKAYDGLQRWLEDQGKDISIGELTKTIFYNERIFNGQFEINYDAALAKQYSKLESEISTQLASRLKNMSRYRYILLAGGGAKPLKPYFEARYKLNQEILFPQAFQMLNCYGAYILYQLSFK
jgi:hypothetical protein